MKIQYKNPCGWMDEWITEGQFGLTVIFTQNLFFSMQKLKLCSLRNKNEQLFSCLS